MVPTTQEIARQLALMAELDVNKTISEMAFELGLSPLFVINALVEGEGMGLFKRSEDNDKLIPSNTLDYADGTVFGADLTRIQDEMLRAITDANRREEDIETGLFYHAWLKGVRESAITMAIHILKQIGFVTSYKLADPSDPKSEYEFLTLPINVGKDWGAKQFKPKEEKEEAKEDASDTNKE